MTVTTVSLGDAVATAQVTTLRPDRPKPVKPVEGESIAFPTGKKPHARSSVTCGMCHDPHGSPMNDRDGQPSALLVASTVRATCVTCHDGTGSRYSALAHDVERVGLPPGESVAADLLMCASCHEPHGVGGNARLFRSAITFVSDDPGIGRPWTMWNARAATFLPLQKSPGDDPNRYLVCLTCHQAHGSRAAPDFPNEREGFERITGTYGTWCAACHNL